MSTRKLYYVPGLISLIGLPVLLLFFNLENSVGPSIIRLHLPSNDTVNTAIFSKAFIDSFIKTKSVEQIYLDDCDGDEYLLNRKINFITKELERIEFTNDTSRVLQVYFGTTSTYGNFVTLLNLAYRYRIHRFAYYDNQFLFCANNPPSLESFEPMVIGEQSVSTIAEGPTQWDIFYWQMKDRLEQLCFEIRQNILLPIGFLVLIFIPALIHLIIKRKTNL